MKITGGSLLLKVGELSVFLSASHNSQSVPFFSAYLSKICLREEKD